MSKGTTTQNDFIKVVFLNAGNDPAWRSNANVYISLHTADPSAGDQTTNEANYTNYTRVAVLKTAVGWTIAGNQASNAGQIQFPQCGVAGNVITHVAIGSVTGPGAGQIFYAGALNDPLAVVNLIQPQFSIGALQVSET